MSVSIGVIGTGVHGMHHVRLLSGMKDITFAGIYDVDGGVRESVSNEFGIPAYDSLDSLLTEVDCVSVAVPTVITSYSIHYTKLYESNTARTRVDGSIRPTIFLCRNMAGRISMRRSTSQKGRRRSTRSRSTG